MNVNLTRMYVDDSIKQAVIDVITSGQYVAFNIREFLRSS